MESGRYPSLPLPAGVLLCAFAVKAAVAASSGEMLMESEYLADVPVVLSASRLAQPVAEAPGAVTVIDRDMIRASGFREIPDLFRLVPGFYVGYFDGTMATVNHGLPDQYSRRMQVLVDGRSIYTPLFGGVEWADLPLAMEDIERIEVIRGPNAASYGANAFLGIINIITRHASEDKGTHLAALGGDKGIGQGTLRHAGNLGDLAYRITLSHREDSGFDNKFDSKRSDFFTVRGDYVSSPTDEWQFQLGLNKGEREAGFADDEIDQPRDHRINSHFEQLRWARAFDAGNELSVQFYHTYHDNRTAYSTVAYPYSALITINSADISFDVMAERFDLELQHIVSPLRDVRVVWGVGARLDQVTSPFYFNTADTQSNHLKRLFGNLEWRVLPNFLVNAGTMIENHELTGTDSSPRLAANYAFLPNHTLRASISKALRMPVLLEDRADYRLNMPVTVAGNQGSWNYPLFRSVGGLLPEKIYSQEIGYLGEIKDWGTTVDFRLYRDRIYDLISNHGIQRDAVLRVGPLTQTSSIGVHSFLNQNVATLSGTELQIRYRADRDTQLIFNHGYSHVVSTDVEDIISRTTPAHAISLLGMRHLGGDWHGSIGYYRVGGLYALGYSTPVESYQRLDVRLAHRFKSAAGRGEVALVAQNLLDDYNDFRSDNVFDRRAYLSLSLDF